MKTRTFQRRSAQAFIACLLAVSLILGLRRALTQGAAAQAPALDKPAHRPFPPSEPLSIEANAEETSLGEPGLSFRSSSIRLSTAANWTAAGDQAWARFGLPVSIAGDVNGDGYDDVIVAEYAYSTDTASNKGKVVVYHGSATGLSIAPNWTVEGDQADAFVGDSVNTAGDVNGDGYDDVIIGAWGYDHGEEDEGRAFVYYGSATGLSSTPDWIAEGNKAFAHFGSSVGTAGDVNNDGYDDIIVGAEEYENGQDREGRAFVYHGSATGLSTTPDWTAEIDREAAFFGSSVSTAGDVNGDGYDDVIVGAVWYQNGQVDEGGAFVYHGSVAGLSTIPNWTAEGDQIGAQFGSPVNAARDVNDDGYDDVIVGAPAYDNGQADEGRAFVYLGSVAGLSATPNWAAESDQAGAGFGGSVGTAGDVNGDGYADVIIGASDYHDGQSGEGQAYVYLGSASGLGAIADWTAEGNQPDVYFGASVGTAGDVNGDGHADIIVGAPLYNEVGWAFVYHGSPPTVECVDQVGGASYAATVQENYVYVGDGSRLNVLDISDPANPSIVGRTAPLPGIVSEVTVIGDLAYVAIGYGGMSIIRMTDPANPIVLGVFDTPGYADGIAVAGAYAFIADSWGGLRIVDISDPLKPSEVGFYDTPDRAEGVAAAGNYAYVAAKHSGLRVLDVSNPANPNEVGFYDTPDWANDVVLMDDYAYVADWGEGLRIIDVSDPANPTETGSYDTPHTAHNVATSGNYAYVADSFSGLRVIDVSDPTSPTESGFHEPPYGSYNNVAAVGGYAYVVTGWSSELRVINVSDPANPTEVGFYDTLGRAYGVATSGNHVYVADGDGLRVIDATNPISVTEVSSLQTPGDAQQVAVRDSYAYVADRWGGLRIIDISDPAHPTETRAYVPSGEPWDVTTAGDYAYLADGGDWEGTGKGLRIINVSDPTNPTEVGFHETSESAYGVAVSGSHAYVAADNAGLHVLDISDPSNPFEVGVYAMSGALNVTVVGTRAYVTSWSDGRLHILDISNPATPAELGSYEPPDSARAVTVAGAYAYVAADTGGLRIINISNLANLTEVGFFDTPGYAQAVAMDGNYLYVADRGGGLAILRVTSTPAACPDSQNPLGVGVEDIQAVGLFWRWQYTDLGWGGIKRFDLDRNGRVDVVDLTHIASVFGMCP